MRAETAENTIVKLYGARRVVKQRGAGVECTGRCGCRLAHTPQLAHNTLMCAMEKFPEINVTT